MVGAHPAATVILLSETSAGFEVLLLKRNDNLDFCGGSWVFPGGKIDPEDYKTDSNGDIMAAARIAAAREVNEEAGIIIESDRLIFMSHWTTPASLLKRFSTYYFITTIRSTAVTVDGEEIMDYRWRQPDIALSEHHNREIHLPFPTQATLETLSRYPDIPSTLKAIRQSDPGSY